jgi:hypothetical protein
VNGRVAPAAARYRADAASASEGGPLTVPAESCSVTGDSRDDSLDSRPGCWFVPAEKLIGRANYVYCPGSTGSTASARF